MLTPANVSAKVSKQAEDRYWSLSLNWLLSAPRHVILARPSKNFPALQDPVHRVREHYTTGISSSSNGYLRVISAAAFRYPATLVVQAPDQQGNSVNTEVGASLHPDKSTVLSSFDRLILRRLQEPDLQRVHRYILKLSLKCSLALTANALERQYFPGSEHQGLLSGWLRRTVLSRSSVSLPPSVLRLSEQGRRRYIENLREGHRWLPTIYRRRSSLHTRASSAYTNILQRERQRVTSLVHRYTRHGGLGLPLAPRIGIAQGDGISPVIFRSFVDDSDFLFRTIRIPRLPRGFLLQSRDRERVLRTVDGIIRRPIRVQIPRPIPTRTARRA